MTGGELAEIRAKVLVTKTSPLWTAVPKGQGHPVLEALIEDRNALMVELDETIAEFRELVRAIEGDRNEVRSISGYLGARLTDARTRIARWDDPS
jgi:hypothetical protein